MFNLFSQLNSSIIFNSAITFTLAIIILYPIICFILGSIADICKQRKAERDRINSIPYLSWNELRKLAKVEGIKVKRSTNKYQLQNILIHELC